MSGGNQSGNAGSVRIKNLRREQLAMMEKHGKREDALGQKRRVRDVPPLVHGSLDLVQAYEAHVEGAKRSARSQAVALHGFLQWPKNLELTPENKQWMLTKSVEFINNLHGGQAVFAARLDCDEEGEHGVDVFFAPLYDKVTKRGVDRWVSLTKFGKALAISRHGRDDLHLQGRALQDEWLEHLREEAGLEWAERGEPKKGHHSDWLTPELYKLKKEQAAVQEMVAAAERNRISSQEELKRAREEAEVIRNQANAEADSIRAGVKKAAEDLATPILEEARARLREAEADRDQAKSDLKTAIEKAAQTFAVPILDAADTKEREAGESLVEARRQAAALLASARQKAEGANAEVLEEAHAMKAAAQAGLSENLNTAHQLREREQRSKRALQDAERLRDAAKVERQEAQGERKRWFGLREGLEGLLEAGRKLALKWRILEAALLWMREAAKMLDGRTVPGFDQENPKDAARIQALEAFHAQAAPIEQGAEMEREEIRQAEAKRAAELERRREETRYDSGPSFGM